MYLDGNIPDPCPRSISSMFSRIADTTFWLTKPLTITVAFTCHVITYDASFLSRRRIFATIFCLFGLEQDGLGDWTVFELFHRLMHLVQFASSNLLLSLWFVVGGIEYVLFLFQKDPQRILSSKCVEFGIILSLSFSALDHSVGVEKGLLGKRGWLFSGGSQFLHKKIN